jgi:hypothetical protein
MTDLLLGLIALGTLITAVLQVVVIVSLVRTGKTLFARVERLRVMVQPLPAHLAVIQTELARAQAIAGQQVGRIAAIYNTLEPPLRHGMTALTIIRSVSGLFQRRSPRR